MWKWFVLSLALLIIFFSRQDTVNKNVKLEPLFINPPEQLEHTVFGYKEVAAHSLWVRVIQDLDYCENAERKKMKGCKGRWAFHMLDKITDLLPNYRSVYSLGGIVLTIVVGDTAGAGILFEKALKNFPEDWQLAYKAAYYYMYEDRQPLKAARLLQKAGLYGGPKWVFLLASRLYTESGRSQLGESMAQILEKQGYSSEIVKKVRERAKQP